MGRSRVCILSFTNIARDARVLRQIEYASHEYAVDVIGFGKWAPPWPRVRFWELRPTRWSRRERLRNAVLLVAARVLPRLWSTAYWFKEVHRQALDILSQNQYDLIHANELSSLPVAVAAAEKTAARVLFDAHEYTPESRATYGTGRCFKVAYATHLLCSFGPRADAFVTVAPGIAELYRHAFGLDAEVVMNAPSRSGISFRPVDPEHIHLVHHGGAIRRRRLERMIEMMSFLDDRFTLHFMLVKDEDNYIQELRQLAAKLAPGRVFFRDPVPPAQVVSTIADFDIGVFLLPAVIPSYRYALPNKFFDFIAAGLAIAIGPSPEMARLVTEYSLGTIAPGFEARDMATAIASLSVESINQMKRNALRAAESLNADVEMRKLMSIYEGLLG